MNRQPPFNRQITANEVHRQTANRLYIKGGGGGGSCIVVAATIKRIMLFAVNIARSLCP